MFAALVMTWLAVMMARETLDVARDLLRLDTWTADARAESWALADAAYAAVTRETGTRWARLMSDVVRADNALTLLDSLEPRFAELARIEARQDAAADADALAHMAYRDACTGQRDCECLRCGAAWAPVLAPSEWARGVMALRQAGV